MPALEIAKAVAREATKTIATQRRIIKAQQGAIIVLVIAFCIALFGWHSCISAM